jgi:hypothetical protein
MANIQERKTKEGTISYRVLIRLKGYPITTATFERKTDAKRWAQQTEAAMREGRYFKTSEAKKHTVADMVDRYIENVIPTKPKSGEACTARRCCAIGLMIRSQKFDTSIINLNAETQRRGGAERRVCK